MILKLPSEIILHYIIPRLSKKDLYKFSIVDKRCQQLVFYYLRKQIKDGQGNLILRDMCKLGYEPSVDYLLRHGNITSKEINRFSFRAACANGHYSVIKRLLKDGRTDPSLFKSFCLISASANGHADVVKLLLEHGAVDPRTHESRCLYDAVKHKHTKVVELLLKDGRVDIETQQNFCLRTSASNGMLDIFKMLVRKLPQESRDIVYYSIYNIAVYGGQLEIIKYIWEHTSQETIKKLLLYERTLYGACQWGKIDIVRYVLDNTDVDVNFNSKTLNMHADPADYFYGNHTGYKYGCLRIAAKHGHADVVELLLKHPDTKDPEACFDNSFEYAVNHYHHDVIRVMITDARVTPTLKQLTTCCGSDNHLGIVDLFLYSGKIDINASTDHYTNPFINAIRYGAIGVVRRFLDFPAFNPTGATGCSAMHYACQNGRLEIVKLLIKDGRFPIEPGTLREVVKSGYNEILELLLTCDVDTTPVMEQLIEYSNRSRCCSVYFEYLQRKKI